MRRGYRYFVLAAFGWLSLGASPKEQTPKPHQPQAAKQAQKPVKPSPAPAVKAVETPKYQPPCREPRDKDRCDLEAQWESADASRDAAKWAYWQFVASTAGILGLGYNLYLTRKAVLLAGDATKDADNALAIAAKSADASVKLAEISQSTSERQLRAYVYLDSADLTHGEIVKSATGAGLNISIVMKIKNYGLTPAVNVRISVALGVDTYPERSLAVKYAEGTSEIDVPPRHHTLNNQILNLADRDVGEIRSGSEAVYVYLRVAYVDTFGSDRLLETCLVCNRGDFDKGVMRPYPQGQYAD